MDWMKEDEYGKLIEKAQQRKEWIQWTFGPAGKADNLKTRTAWI